MQKIIFGFSKHKGFAPMSWLIMLCERTEYSHAFIKIPLDNVKRDLIYQATGKGVYFIGKDLFKEHNIIVKEFEFEVSNESRRQLLQYAIDNSGKSYSLIQLIGLLCKRLCRKLFKRTINNPIKDKRNSFICTEIAAAGLKELGFPVEDDLDSIGLRELGEIIPKLKKG